MTNKIKTTAVLLLASVLASACSTSSDRNEVTPPPSPVSQSLESSAAVPNSAARPENATKSSSLQEQAVSVPATADKVTSHTQQSAKQESRTQPQATPVARTYKMSPRTYDIVPIDASKHPKEVVLLTFDDGPKDLELNQALLDTLDKHQAKAIFFVNGYRVKQKPDIVKLIHERGHAIGNHSWDHIDLKKQTKEKIAQQLEDVQDAVKAITGEAPVFFRPPFGSGNDEVRAKSKELGMLYMTWSNGSKDWEMTVKRNSAQEVTANVIGQLRPGSNILMHELPWTAEALDDMLSQIKKRGYGFVDPHAIDPSL
ncbi:polysaccharide deacetylase family protein [Paenibacillus sp. YYML68]|uniref:polysaccharide deacetylase family protein n=1 Tax=Paenibacillus sp. YYML68 TaxID=2909250 RepID=UPI002491C6D2|nr:polysaccharide deacetylase family protein [Paenibacillus sp. YYML68]